jgi:S1-C subfamily serine protease
VIYFEVDAPEPRFRRQGFPTKVCQMGSAVRVTLVVVLTVFSGAVSGESSETLSGSGVVISAKGEILTNAHVVEAC